MKQYYNDGEVVTYKLEKITFLLNNLGKLCALHQLEERDLPPSLHGILQRLRMYAACIPDPSYRWLIHNTQVNWMKSGVIS
jgi:hypothetical protein